MSWGLIDSTAPPIDEFDFYNAQYLAAPPQAGVDPESILLLVEVVLRELSAEIDAKCGGNTEFWHLEEKRLLEAGEAQAANPPHVVPCLRLETIGKYDLGEDEFEAKTFFSHWAAAGSVDTALSF